MNGATALPAIDGPVLADIHLPPEPSWWPPAPGWWLLALLGIALALWLARAWRQRWRRRALMHLFLGELDRLEKASIEPVSAAHGIAGLSSLLRRLMRHLQPASATLRDLAWLQHLDAGDPACPFSEGAGRMLLELPYRRAVDPAQAAELFDLARRQLPRWLGAYGA